MNRQENVGERTEPSETPIGTGKDAEVVLSATNIEQLDKILK